MLIRILIFAMLAIALEFVNGFFAFMLPPFLVITPACLLLGVIWAIRRRRDPTIN